MRTQTLARIALSLMGRATVQCMDEDLGAAQAARSMLKAIADGRLLVVEPPVPVEPEKLE